MPTHVYAEVVDPEEDRRPDPRRPPDRMVRLSPRAWAYVQLARSHADVSMDQAASALCISAGKVLEAGRSLDSIMALVRGVRGLLENRKEDVS